MTNLYYSNTPEIKSIEIAGHTYRYGACHTGFFIRETRTGKRNDFYSAKSLNWFIDMMVDAAAKLEPEPTEPAPVLLPSVSVAACEENKKTVKLSEVQRATLARMASGEQLNTTYEGTYWMSDLKTVRFATVESLIKRKLIVSFGWTPVGCGYQLTQAGRAALGKPETVSKLVNPVKLSKRIDSVRLVTLKRYQRGLEIIIWRINTGQMSDLDWHLLYGRFLIAKSVYGYMPQSWVSELRGIADDADKHNREVVLPALRNLLERVKQEIVVENIAALDKPETGSEKTTLCADASPEEKIAVDYKPTKRVGEYYNRNLVSLSDCVNRFNKKHGSDPTLIELNTEEQQKYNINPRLFFDIPIVYTDACPSGKVHLSYDPAAAK